MMLERLLNEALGFKRPAPRKRPTAKHFAIFPDGTETEILRKGRGKFAYFSLTSPTGDRVESNYLRDVKHFAELDFPGVRFIKRDK